MTITTFDNRVQVIGTRTFLGSTTTTTGYIGSQGTLTSYSNPYPYRSGTYFNSTIETSSDCFVTGTANSVVYNNCRILSSTHPGIAAPTGLTAADLLASTNPSKPIVDVPIFLFELREVPMLLKLAGDTLLKKGASANLSYEFGWKPLLRDLSGLLNIQASIDKRVRHLQSLHDRGGSSHRGEVGLVQFSPGRAKLATIVGGSTLYVDYSGFCRRWLSVSWVPVYSTISGMPTSSQIRQQAFRAALGLTIDSSTIWNALPWTWLIDWFGNLGSYLASRRNVVGFVPGQCYQMTHTEMTTLYTQQGSSTLQVSLPSFHKVVKTRSGVSPSSVSASLPFLSARQLGILTSLAIQRR